MSLNKKILDKFPSKPSTRKRFLPPDELKLHKEFCNQLSSTFSRLAESSEVKFYA